MSAEPTSSRPRVGVSSCLLGHQVRFDGGHKRQAFLLDDLAGFVDLVPVCPEVEMGLGVPRETLRLVAESIPATVSVVGTDGRYRFANTAFLRWCGRARASPQSPRTGRCRMRRIFCA